MRKNDRGPDLVLICSYSSVCAGYAFNMTEGSTTDWSDALAFNHQFHGAVCLRMASRSRGLSVSLATGIFVQKKSYHWCINTWGRFFFIVFNIDISREE